MAAYIDLLKQVDDIALRKRLNDEYKKLSKGKKFGLVFEDHIPEFTPLYNAEIKQGSSVAIKSGKINNTFTVKTIKGKNAVCIDSNHNEHTLPLKSLVYVARFGETVFPTLEPIDNVINALDSDLWHMLIEADNYHALQLLEYLYPKKVDCIYIDPPYNSGAKDWKYNNDYVDSNDAWRHSKWLAMMEKRLKLAKRLLNPENSVLIVTIDEKEYLHLGCLLKELFIDANIQMISSVISQKGVARLSSFHRINEFIFIVQLGASRVSSLPLSKEWFLGKKDSAASKGVVWSQLRRSGTNDLRIDRPNLFYPIIFNKSGTKIISAGEPLEINRHPESSLEEHEDCLVLWPIKESGVEGNWQISNEELMKRSQKGYVKIGKKKEKTIPLSYLAQGSINKIDNNEVIVLGIDENTGTVIVDAEDYKYNFVPGSQWDIELHDATYHGSQLLTKIIGETRFDFPKSLYAVRDTIRFFIADNPNAVILDFFAGSGTTLHAVNLLNNEDNGKRKCILVTNNEVSESETEELTALGLHPGDLEWEAKGICRSVTWPRTVNSVLGKRADGTLLKDMYVTNEVKTVEQNRRFRQLSFIDNPADLTIVEKKQVVALIGKENLPQSLIKADSKYILSDEHVASILFEIEATDEWLEALDEQYHITDFFILTKSKAVYDRVKNRVVDLLGPIIIEEPLFKPMADGFTANVEYFKLGFLDKDRISIGRQFREMLPLLWMKAGAIGKRPEIESEELPAYLMLPQNNFAVLLNISKYAEFTKLLKTYNSITTVYFVTNSDERYKDMIKGINAKTTYQLYDNYIENFVLGSIRR